MHFTLFISVPRYVRLNTLLLKKAEAMEYFEREGWRLIENTFETYDDFLEAVKNLDDESFIADFHIKNLFVFPSSSKKHFASNELAAEGKLLLQDKASCLPSFLLDPPHKSTVLDMCAAPGNKTTHLAAIMKNKGKIYAIEMNARRFTTLSEMVEGTNATVIQPMNRDVLEIKDEDVPNVQYILLDPSCSGSGIVNRFASDSHKDSNRLYKLSGLQFKLLMHAMTSFPNVKRIVYSTCSIYPEENEEVVQSCLQKIGHFKLANAPELLNNQWNNFGNEKSYPGLGNKVIYARMGEEGEKSDLTNGFFVAVLERCEDGEEFNEFYMQKQQNVSVHSDKFGKRKKSDINEEAESVREEEPEEEGEKPKKKKKWINKGYNQ
jgi:putative methyltransferase